MARAPRFFQILQILRRARAPVSAEKIAAETGVSLRTIYRDIASLQAEGADIAGEAGLGYVLRPGFDLPPLMFSPVEIEALMLGARFVKRRGDPQLSQAASDALAKISAVLPRHLRDRPEDTPLIVGPMEKQDGLAEAQRTLREAIRREVKVTLTYEDQKNNQTKRVIWPFTLAFFSNVEVLAAWCEMRRDYRHFRIDRISRLTVSDAHYDRPRRALQREWRTKIEQGLL